MSRLAGQTVTFVSFTAAGDRGALGMKIETPVETVVPGCRMRPMTAKEITEGGFEAGLQLWKCTAPYTDVTAALADTGYLLYGGDTFAVIGGARPFTDLDGNTGVPAHVSVYAQKAT